MATTNQSHIIGTSGGINGFSRCNCDFILEMSTFFVVFYLIYLFNFVNFIYFFLLAYFFLGRMFQSGRSVKKEKKNPNAVLLFQGDRLIKKHFKWRNNSQSLGGEFQTVVLLYSSTHTRPL